MSITTTGNKFFLNFKSVHFKWAAIFLISTLIAEIVLLFPGRELNILESHASEGRYLRLAGVITISLISILVSFLFIYTALRSSWVARSIFFIVFSFITLAEYSFHLAAGRFSNFTVLGLMMFVGNYGFLVDAARQYVSWIGLIPIIPFAVLMIAIKPDKTFRRSYLAILTLILTGFFSASTFFTGNEYYTTALSAGMRSIAEYPIVWFVGTVRGYPRRAAYNAPRIQLSNIPVQKPSNNIVLIIDESVRADHLSLNGYPVDTATSLTAFREKGLLKNWGTAASGSTCSVQSNNLLLTGMKIEPDPNFDIYRLPTIFQYARMMGYTTYGFDGQAEGQWLGKPADLDFIDQKVIPEDLGSSGSAADVDSVIAKRVREIVQTSSGNFIWINKAGVHSRPFRNIYPGLQYDPSTLHELLVAAYDRTVNDNLEQFFAALLPNSAMAADTVYIYTSDHGQTLMENGAKLSHCTDTKVEASVPLFVISDPRATDNADTNFAASHENIFAAILDLMHVPLAERRYDYAPSFLSTSSRDSKPRTFKAGDASDHPGEIIKFDQ